MKLIELPVHGNYMNNPIRHYHLIDQHIFQYILIMLIIIIHILMNAYLKYITNIELELLTDLSSVLSIPNQGESTLNKGHVDRISQNKNITIDISNISSSDNYENIHEHIVDLGDITNNNDYDFSNNNVSINGFWISSDRI